MNLIRSFRNSTFHRQLTLVVAVGVLLLAILSSLAISWQGSREIRLNRQSQGLQVAASLARQARLALLYDSGENAADAVAATLAFPDVARVEIRRPNGQLLLARGVKGFDEAGATEALPVLNGAALLEAENPQSWRFVATVAVAAGELDSPFEMHEKPVQALGYVRVVLSKSTMNEAVLALFTLNLAIAFFFALLFLLVTRALARRLTRPLFELADAMQRAEQGEAGVRADLRGPRDIVQMAHAFNSMMKVLDEREQALRQAHEDALRFARLKADFAATMSHELRTPLNGVVGTLDMLRASALPPMPRRYVDLAWDSSQYLLDLINNILDFSSLEAGKLALAEEDFDMSRLCEQSIELVASSAARKSLEVGYVIASGVPQRLRGDARRLRQILVNLLGNAVKFTERGEVAIRVSPTDGFAAHGLLRFEVADTGIGVPLASRDAIFDSFTQADTTSTRRHDGSGLGLAICKQLCRLMGGEIGVDSEPGMGSTFWFTVPLTLAQSPLSGTEGVAPGGRVLLVDESVIVRQFLEQSLSACGYACGSARSLREAAFALEKAAAEQVPYRLLMVDTLLASQDTAELARLREAPSLGLPRLILMNRYGAEHDAALKADACLTKPLRLERLRESLAAATGGAPLAASAGGVPRILVVEDNRTSQTIAIGMLEMLGCSATLAENGRLAVQAFKRSTWDLILMDCNMPEMDGFAATAAIRALQHDGERRVPIVAMTANTQPSDVEKCLAAGMDDHLSKPLMLGGLTARLRRWLPHLALLPPSSLAAADDASRAPDGVEAADEPVNRIVLGRLREALGGAIGRAIEPFVEDMPIYLEALDAATASGDSDAQRRAAHAVKGAAGNLGAHALSALAREVEGFAFAGQCDAAGQLLTRLRAEYALVRRVLVRELANEPAVPAISASASTTQAGAAGLVLVVDDDRSTRAALRAALEVSGFAVAEAGDGSAVLAEVERLHPDVILMDALMPVMDGFAACARLQESALGREIPVLMITALDDNVSIERAFAAGASDYIPKPLHLAVVNQRVRRLVEATRTERHVRHLAYNDTLTGLPNRATFNEHLHRCIGRTAQSGLSLALLYLDLDRFKFVNDTLGHETGDRLLKAVAERLRACVRASDCVARLGGDEFAIVVDEFPANNGTNIVSAAAQKICRSLNASFEIEGHDIVVSASVGIAVFPGDGLDAGTLLRRADTAMYRAKKKNCGFQFFEEGMEASATEHLRLEGALRRALERHELAVFYQPIAEADSERIVGMEALVRWRHPARGLVSPAEFIPLAEETGLIVPIGEWVLRTACQQLKAWMDEGMNDLYVTVNLSGLQLQQAGFSETLSHVLHETRLDARHLTLEITESVLMEHAEATLLQLQALKATGVGLAIDDFGTGYSSLSYLRRFPVDVLKIDQTFTRDMVRNADDASIVSGVVALAHNLRLKVVAEGVETETQRAFLSNLRCNFIQGYLLSEPVPADVFAARHLSGRGEALRDCR